MNGRWKLVGWIGLALLGLAAQPCAGQSLAGVWFEITPAGLIQVAIDRDSIRIRRVTTDFRQFDEPALTLPIAQMAVLPDRQLLIVRQGRDTVRYSALTIFDVVPGERFQQAWNSPGILADTPTALVQQQQCEPAQLFGFYCFSAR